MSEKPKRPKRHSWTSVYLAAVARGYDEGYAAMLANAWEDRKQKRSKQQEAKGRG